MILSSRRSFIAGLAALVAAPAVVRASSLMPVRAPKLAMTVEEVIDAMVDLMSQANRELEQLMFNDAALYGRSVVRIRLPIDYMMRNGS